MRIIKRYNDESQEEYEKRKKRIKLQRITDFDGMKPMNRATSHGLGSSSHGGNPYPDVPVLYDCSVPMSCTTPTDCTMTNPLKP